MNRVRALVLACALILISHVTAAANVLTFEDITSGFLGTPISSDYQGFNWDGNFYPISAGTFYGGPAPTFPSGDKGIFNGNGVLTSTVTRSTPFNFNGAYFSPWLNNNEFYEYSSTSITMKGYIGNALVGDITYDLTTTFDYYAANFSNVDRVEFIASLGGTTNNERWWLMDNFTYNAAAVPEPTTLLLLGLGVLGLAGVRRLRG